MKIKPNQDFKHNKKTYKKGRSYEVPNEDGRYFLEAGWVGEGRVSETIKVKSLDIQDMQLGHSAEVEN